MPFLTRRPLQYLPPACRLCCCALLVLALLGGGAQPLRAQTATDSIRLNQVGFYPTGPKVAVVTGAKAEKFFITTPDRRTTVFRGTLRVARAGARTADFSDLHTPGTFVVSVPGTGVSYPFQIRTAVYAPLARAALKSFYYQRASTALPARYAGRWSRPVGHPDDQVLVHPSAATAERPRGAPLFPRPAAGTMPATIIRAYPNRHPYQVRQAQAKCSMAR